MVLMMAISQRAVRWLIGLCIKIGVKLRLCKNPEASMGPLGGSLQNLLL